MKLSIQNKFFAWLALQTFISFATIGIVVFAYNFIEEHEDYEGEVFGFFEERGGEAEESALLIGTLFLMFPINIVAAWFIAKRLLRPWRNLNQQATRVSTGAMEARIHISNPDDEIGQLSAVLNTAFNRHQRLLERVRRISFDVSHQLRNPLAAIQTTGEVCLRNRRAPEEYEDTLGEILQSTSRLRRTIDQLLMLARSAGAPPLEQMELISVQSLMDVVIKEASMIGSVRRIAIELEAPDKPTYVHGVPELLQTAISNLIDNALRFSPKEKTILITILPSDRAVRVGVRDEGPGLSPEQEKILFQPLKHNSDGRKESIGLGLAIVSDICKAHSGTVGFRNLAPQGCLFWIDLPLPIQNRTA